MRTLYIECKMGAAGDMIVIQMHNVDPPLRCIFIYYSPERPPCQRIFLHILFHRQIDYSRRKSAASIRECSISLCPVMG